MENNLCIRIGHLKIVDHLVLGITDLQIKNKKMTPVHSTFETIQMNSWDQVCDELTEGNISGAFMTVPLAMDLFAAGLDIKILMFTHRAGSIVVKKKASEFNCVADFRNKCFLIPSSLSVQNMLLHRLLSTAGLRLGLHEDTDPDVTGEIAHPFLMNEMMINDTDNDIAGFAVEEPFGSEAVQKNIATEVCTSGSLWKDHPCCVFVIRQAVLEKHPEAVEEIISLFVQSAERLEESKDDTLLAMAQEFLGQDKEIVNHVLFESNIRFDPSLLVPDIEALNLIQDYMSDTMGVLKHKIDMNHLVDSSYILNE